jgi:hypothetical protein
VALYVDDSWQSRSWIISLDDYVAERRHQVSESIHDQATFIAFNLPVGAVMTLMDNTVPLNGKQLADLSDCGRSVDLVGSGTTQGVDLNAVNMNDCISMFFWRQVDVRLGVLVLFVDIDFASTRTCLFLAEWQRGTPHDLGRWYIQDRVSSARWTLDERQSVTLADNTDGSGATYENIRGASRVREVADLREFRFNDCASSFRWDAVAPRRERIAPIDLRLSDDGGTLGLSSVVSGTNASELPQTVNISLTDSQTQSITVATSDTLADSVTTKVEQKSTVKVGDLGGAEMTWSLEVSHSYSHTDSSEESKARTVELKIEDQMAAPPWTNYTATLLAKIGKLPPTT